MQNDVVSDELPAAFQRRVLHDAVSIWYSTQLRMSAYRLVSAAWYKNCENHSRRPFQTRTYLCGGLPPEANYYLLIVEVKSIAPAMFRLTLPSDFIYDSSHVASEAVDFSLSFPASFVHRW